MRLCTVHEMNTCRAGPVCLSVCIIQLESRRTDLDETVYGRHAIGVYLRLTLRPYSDVWLQIFGKYETWKVIICIMYSRKVAAA